MHALNVMSIKCNLAASPLQDYPLEKVVVRMSSSVAVSEQENAPSEKTPQLRSAKKPQSSKVKKATMIPQPVVQKGNSRQDPFPVRATSRNTKVQTGPPTKIPGPIKQFGNPRRAKIPSSPRPKVQVDGPSALIKSRIPRPLVQRGNPRKDIHEARTGPTPEVSTDKPDVGPDSVTVPKSRIPLPVKQYGRPRRDKYNSSSTATPRSVGLTGNPSRPVSTAVAKSRIPRPIKQWGRPRKDAYEAAKEPEPLPTHRPTKIPKPVKPYVQCKCGRKLRPISGLAYKSITPEGATSESEVVASARTPLLPTPPPTPKKKFSIEAYYKDLEERRRNFKPKVKKQVVIDYNKPWHKKSRYHYMGRFAKDPEERSRQKVRCYLPKKPATLDVDPRLMTDDELEQKPWFKPVRYNYMGQFVGSQRQRSTEPAEQFTQKEWKELPEASVSTPRKPAPPRLSKSRKERQFTAEELAKKPWFKPSKYNFMGKFVKETPRSQEVDGYPEDFFENSVDWDAENPQDEESPGGSPLLSVSDPRLAKRHILRVMNHYGPPEGLSPSPSPRRSRSMTRSSCMSRSYEDTPRVRKPVAFTIDLDDIQDPENPENVDEDLQDCEVDDLPSHQPEDSDDATQRYGTSVKKPVAFTIDFADLPEEVPPSPDLPIEIGSENPSFEDFQQAGLSPIAENPLSAENESPDKAEQGKVRKAVAFTVPMSPTPQVRPPSSPCPANVAKVNQMRARRGADSANPAQRQRNHPKGVAFTADLNSDEVPPSPPPPAETPCPTPVPDEPIKEQEREQRVREKEDEPINGQVQRSRDREKADEPMKELQTPRVKKAVTFTVDLVAPSPPPANPPRATSRKARTQERSVRLLNRMKENLIRHANREPLLASSPAPTPVVPQRSTPLPTLTPPASPKQRTENAVRKAQTVVQCSIEMAPPPTLTPPASPNKRTQNAVRKAQTVVQCSTEMTLPPTPAKSARASPIPPRKKKSFLDPLKKLFKRMSSARKSTSKASCAESNGSLSVSCSLASSLAEDGSSSERGNTRTELFSKFDVLPPIHPSSKLPTETRSQTTEPGRLSNVQALPPITAKNQEPVHSEVTAVPSTSNKPTRKEKPVPTVEFLLSVPESQIEYNEEDCDPYWKGVAHPARLVYATRKWNGLCSPDSDLIQKIPAQVMKVLEYDLQHYTYSWLVREDNEVKTTASGESLMEKLC